MTGTFRAESRVNVIPTACVVTLCTVIGVVWLLLHCWGPATLGAMYVAVVSVPLTAIDVREYRLPNALVLPGYAVATVGILVARPAAWELVPLVLCPLLVIGTSLFGWYTTGLGMGDVKLAGLLAESLAAVMFQTGQLGTLFVRIGVWAFLIMIVVAVSGVCELFSTRRPMTDIALGPVFLSVFWFALFGV